MAQENKLKSRDEMDSAFKWRLEDIYPSNEEWEADFKKASDTEKLKVHSGKLGKSATALKNALDDITETGRIMEKLYVYAHMRRDEDNAKSLYQGMTDRASQLGVQIEAATSYLIPEILKIPEDRLKEYMQERGMEIYRHMLHDINRRREHTLDEAQERLLALAGETTGAPQNIFRMLDHADMHFPVVKDDKGEEVELTHGNYILFMENYDRRVREDAFKALYATYKSFENTLAATYSSSVKSDLFYSRARKYPSALEMSLSSDNVPLSVYDSLIEAVHARLPLMYRYVELRKKVLGVEQLNMYDLYTPIVSGVEMKVSFDEAKAIVKSGLAPLGERYAGLLEKAYSQSWMDVYENRGKTSGAYCWGAYGTHPYVLLNFQPTIDHAFTIAHELGHAMHSYLSDEKQPYVMAQYKIFVAEVASTVNEVLLTRYLLKTESDKQKRMYLLNHFLDQFRTTLYRQVMFAEFEKITHALAEKGEPLTSERLSKEYIELNRLYYGDQMYSNEEIAMEWSRIPHFYNAFYVYKYATGFSAAVAIAEHILSTGNASHYLDFLSSGGSDYPIELLKIAGVDLSTPQPVISALGVFESTLGELEKLMLGGN